jgi:hypothetical protein
MVAVKCETLESKTVKKGDELVEGEVSVLVFVVLGEKRVNVL